MKLHAYSDNSISLCCYISLCFTMGKQRANFPYHQLNSEILKNIKGAAIWYLSLIVIDKCIVMSCTLTGNIDEGLQEGWNEVCRTWDACDKALQGLYSKWIEMSIMNPCDKSIGRIKKPDFDIIFCRSKKWPFSLVLSAHKGQRKRRRKNKTTLRIREMKVIASISQVKC